MEAAAAAAQASWWQSAAAAAAIQGSAVAAGNGFMGIGARKQQKRAIDAQERANALSRQWQQQDLDRQEAYNWEMWNKTNEYNNWYYSPAHQREQYEEAGFKYMPQGWQGQGASVGQALAPNTPTAESGFDSGLAQQENSAWSNMLTAPVESGLNAFEKIKGINAQVAQTNLLKQQALNTEANTEYVQKAAALLVAQTLGIDIDNEIKQATKPEQIAQIKENYNLLVQNVAKATAEAQVMAASAQSMGPEYVSYCKNHWKTQEFIDSQNAVLKELEVNLSLKYKEEEVKAVVESARQTAAKIREEVSNLKYYNSDEIRDIVKKHMTGDALQSLAQGEISNQIANARTHSGKAASQAQAEAEANVAEETQLGAVDSANFKNSKIYLWTDAVTTMVSRLLGAGMVGRFLYNQNFKGGSSLNLQQPTLEQSMSIRASAGQGVIFDKFGNPM